MSSSKLEKPSTGRRHAPAAPLSYHHGDLRRALIDATTELLREQGLEGFSLRAAARAAGVSHAAPAHHFGDARGLLTACAADGFERLADAMHARMNGAGADARDRAQALGVAYIDFALTHRALFQLMFRRDRLDPEDAALQAAGRRTGDALRQVYAELIAERGLPPSELGERILLAWSCAHGYATLVLEEQTVGLYGLGAGREEAASAMGAKLLQLLMGGLADPA
ncbi:TetR family transcriptional regulator [Hylemonella gracilis str. Niagara R]|uniref:TetR family transcriptional regulator n=1 Tax=Hylemonella gracilis str. Niagara R TaxID=1458275 RepID=A0A016XKU4_9BURK|nr:TetR/AcrR family transcriptional regulator [Hylemonella gracilis]EYC52456.1 TetR family transcriptional regulator [Hylemonella gracilis str. Niagara R]